MVPKCNYVELVIDSSLYSVLSINPVVPLVWENSGGSTTYHYQLQYNLEYTVTYGVNGCTNREIVGEQGPAITTPPQMLCPYSETAVTIDHLVIDSNFTYQLNGIPINISQGVPIQVSTFGLNKLNIGNGCTLPFILNPIKNILPQYDYYSITYESNSDGIISVNNGANYQSIEIQGHPDYQFNSGNQYTFRNVSIGSYNLILQSNECGKQIIPITIDEKQRRVPPISLNIVTGISPQFNVTSIQLVGTQEVNPPFYNDTIDSPISTPLYNLDQLNVTYINNITQFSQFHILPSPHFDLVPLSYILDPNIIDFCNSFDIQLNYPLNYQPYITYSTGLAGEYIPLPSNNNIPMMINRMLTFFIQLPGYDRITYGHINVTTPEPVIEIINIENQDNCFYNTSVRVANFHLFSMLEMFIVLEDTTQVKVASSVNGFGYFENIPRSNVAANIVYQSKGQCSPVRSYRFNFNNSEPTTYGFLILLTVETMPTCLDANGYIHANFSSELLNNQTWTVSRPYTPSSSVSFKVEKSPSCSFNYVWQSPPLEPYPPTMTVVKKSSCYSSTTPISISSYLSINKILVDNQEYPYRSQLINVVPGNRTIQIIYGSSYPRVCDATVQMDVPAIGASTDIIKYSIKNAQQCSPPDGSITIESYDQYDKLYVDSVSQSAVDGVISALAPGYHILYYTKLGQDGSCISSSHFTIDSPSVDIQYNIVRQPSCEGDGLVYFNATVGGQQILVESVDQLLTIGDNLFSGLPLPTNSSETSNALSVDIHSGQCRFTKTIQYQVSNYQISVQLQPNCQSKNGQRIDIVANGDIILGDIKAYTTGPVQIINVSPNEISITSFDTNNPYLVFDLKWNQGLCTKKYNVSLDQLLQLPSLKIEYTAPTCQFSDSTVRILNHDQFIISSSNSEHGYFMSAAGEFKSLQPGSSLQLNYIHKQTGCVGSKEINVPVYSATPLGVSQLEITPETCNGAKNGQIEFPLSSNTQYRLVSSDLSNYNFAYQFDNRSASTGRIHSLPAGSYRLTTLVNNCQYCNQEVDLVIPSGEPTLFSGVSKTCLDKTHPKGQIWGKLEGKWDSVEYKLVETSGNNITVPVDVNGTFSGLAEGLYSLQVTTKSTASESCNRVWIQTLEVGVEHFNATISSYNCTETTGFIDIVGTYLFTYSVDNGDVNSPITQTTNQSKIATLSLPLGAYWINFETESGCVYRAQIDVGCTDYVHLGESGMTTKNKLIIGVVVGVVGFAAIVTLSSVIHRHRRNKVKHHKHGDTDVQMRYLG
ncbi:hypothetical protein PPL_12573 [Heterostelium album PN500]|uniref:Uncharacterized protein n=1 Tax=Heterostelium pallidum (strain ATCC 26659 / Pp 5 / PN500) TaxID=670386 RepID=D3BMZ9_HETP5|nr:hypothetical protein PPL_12573 [Heterostelium album PN500]EFA77361.1 hypothetical protein PPL_12573 [Heterostelium album PN500]|eukprot:XP_020429490.1 hypothetical protein PPL_12573 [Heterostelium album PN500]